MIGATSALLIALAASSGTVVANSNFSAAGMLPSPPEPTAGDVPLSRPIAPVPPGMSSWQVSLSVLAGIADPFYDNVSTVLAVRRGFGPLALELWGGRAFSWSGPALSLCTSSTACGSPTASQLGATPGNLAFMGGASAVWRAAEGKVSIGGLGAHRFGLELSLGAAAVQYSVLQNQSSSSLWGPGVRAGIGLEGSITNAFSLRADLQSIVYATDIRNTWSAENQLFAGVTAGWHMGGQ